MPPQRASGSAAPRSFTPSPAPSRPRCRGRRRSGPRAGRCGAAGQGVPSMIGSEFRLTVNGTKRNVSCEPDTSLLDVLRDALGLTGPKYGCGIGVCGACFVLVDGRASASCNLPVSAVTGPVVSVEGLSDGGRLHPVQQAFIDEQAAQCGYCTAGMVVSTVALLRARPSPTDQQVR